MTDRFARNQLRYLEREFMNSRANVRNLEEKIERLEAELKDFKEDIVTGINYLREAVAALYDHLDVKFVKTTEEIGTVDSSRGKLRIEEKVTITAKKASKN